MKTTYIKDYTHFYKTTSEEESVYVRTGVRPQIGIISTIITQGDEIRPSTKEEFEKAYNEVNDILRYAAMGTTKESEAQQKRIEAAGHYLSGSMDEVKEMLVLIDAYDGDENELLSSIEDVSVWAQVEQSLSVEQFRFCIGD